MKKILFVMLAAILFCACAATHNKGNVLPPPVISNKPVVVRLVLNCDGLDVENINLYSELSFRTPTCYEGSTQFRDSVVEGNSIIYEATVNPRMTCAAIIMYQLEEYRTNKEFLHVILVPGDTVTCTVNCKTRDIAYTGRFARLSKELSIYRRDSSEFFPYNLYNKKGFGLPSQELDGLTPDDMAKKIVSRYEHVKKKVMRSKKLSPEFKEVWKIYAASDALDMYSRCKSNYKTKKEYTKDYYGSGKLYSDKAFSKELMPGDDYSIFYHRQILYDSRSIYKIYEEEGYPVKYNDAIRFRDKAREWIQHDDLLLDKSVLAYIKEEMPEYYEPMIEMRLEKLKLRTEWRPTPDKTRICKMDRMLEGEELLDSLLSKYKGKPTFLYIDLVGRVSCPRIKNQYGDIANFVFLTGGEEFSEEEMNSTLFYSSCWDDIYLLMGYQIDYLTKKFCANVDDEFSNSFCLLFDADGKFLIEADDQEFTYNKNEDNVRNVLHDKLMELIGDKNFTLNGTVSESLEDIGYNMLVGCHGTPFDPIVLTDYYVDAANKKFNYSSHLPRPSLMQLTALSPDSLLSSKSMNFLAVPGENCNISINDGHFYLSGSEFYEQWNNADRFVLKTRKEYESKKADAIILNYVSEHSNEPGCIFFVLEAGAVPKHILDRIIPSEMKKGKFSKELIYYGIHVNT